MKIYHGTNCKFLETILKNGLAPRKGKQKGEHRKSNWDEAPSHEDMVYMSTAYPWYYATLTGELDRDGLGTGVVFEIDMELLDIKNIYPDEDFVCEIMKEETPNIELSYIRDNLESYQYLWKNSLQYFRCICHKGTIPVSAITRYCVIDFTVRAQLGFEMIQPVLSIMNYQIKGDIYRNLNLWCFGDVEEIPFAEEAKEDKLSYDESSGVPVEMKENVDYRIDYWSKESKNRTGIEVVCL